MKIFIARWITGLLAVVLLIFGCVRSTVQGTTSQFVAVADTNRILFFQGPITSTQPQATFVLGQPSPTSDTPNNGGIPTGLSGVRSAFYDGSHLIVADTGNSRILIWNTLPQNSLQAADVVLGQPSNSNVGCNWNGVTLQSVCVPSGVLGAQNQLIVADQNNNRILIWKTFPTRLDQAADISISGVLGHPSLAYGGGKLFLFDDGCRALVWNSIPTQNNQPADFVLGQPNTSTYTLNNAPASAGGPGGPTAYGFASNMGGCSTGNNLVVGDRYNNRVLIWNELPTYTWQPADLVLGQPNFNSNSTNNSPGNAGGVTSQGLWSPIGTYCDLKSLYVEDLSNNRVLVWKSYPTYNQQPADFVIGEPDMNTVLAPSSSLSTFGAQPGAIISNSNFFGIYRSGGY